MAAHFQIVTLKFWHGGKFKNNNNGELRYLGGKSRTFKVDPDELCYWEMLEFANKCGYIAVAGVFYLVPGMKLQDGLRRIEGDTEVLEMGELLIKSRCLEVYLMHSDDYGAPLRNRHAVVGHPPVQNVPQTEEVPHVEVAPVEAVPLSQVPPSSEVQPEENPPLTDDQPVGISRQAPKPKTKTVRKKLTPKKGPHPTKVVEGLNTSPRKQQESSTSAKPDFITPSTKPTKKLSSIYQQSHPSLTDPTTTFKPLNPDLRLKGNVKTSEEQADPLLATTNLPPIDLAFDTDYEWEDNRPESPLKWSELVGDVGDFSEESDPEYEPEYEKACEGDDEDDCDLSDIEIQELEFLSHEEPVVGGESDESDGELAEARERVKTVNSRLFEIAQNLQQEALDGKLGQPFKGQPTSNPTEAPEGNTSEYEESDQEIHTPVGSGDEAEASSKSKRELLVRGDTDFSKFVWKVGQRFPNRSEFKEAVSKYAVLQGRDLSYVIANKRKDQLAVKCVGECPFYLYCSMHTRENTWLVKTVVNVHTCQRNMSKNRQLKSTWVASQMLEVFKARPHWPAREIIETVKRAYRVIVRKDFAYKVKYEAHKMLHGSMREHYMKVERYIKALRVASPGTTLELVVDGNPKLPTPVFKRLFVAFDGVKEGWKSGCRRVICVDAAFLKTFLGGQIMTAVGRDPNEQMFPISWAAVEGENNLSWTWFFTHLQSCLELGDGAGVAIISDEHQAILHVVAEVLPKAEHRHCARHIFSLWHRTYKGDEMKLLFWKIAKAYNEADFNDAWDELNELNPEAALAFKRYNPTCFCRAFLDTTIKTDAITNNMAETFNAYIINARTKHLIYMLEDVRVGLMQRLVKKKIELGKCTTVLCPRIQARLDKEKEHAANCDVLPSSDTLFNVRYYLDQLNVDLVERSCSCRKWNMCGIPCCHAVACIFFLNKAAEDYVDDCYKLETYFKAYGGSIPPCEGERYWPRVPCNLDPPPIKIGPGRPRKNRIKHPSENPKKPGSLSRSGIEMTCTICKTKGHNKRRCPDKGKYSAPEPAPKRARGRPRNDGGQPESQPIIPSQMASSSTPAVTPTPAATPISAQHHTTSAQPSRLGRSGRVIAGGQGARGASQSAARGRQATASGTPITRGRGRAKDVVGVGVLFNADGTPQSQPITTRARASGHGRGRGTKSSFT